MAKNFCELFSRAKDGEEIALDKGGVYDVFREDCFCVRGCHCSNTASERENPEGVHRAAAYLKGRKNVTIDGNGASLIVHGKATPFLFEGCRNITVKNLTVDYFRPTMSEFQVLCRDGEGGYTLEICAESLYGIRGGVLYWRGEESRDGGWYWEHAYRGENILSMYHTGEAQKLLMLEKNGCRFPSVPEFSEIREIGKNRLRVFLRDESAELPVGSTVQTRSVVRDELGGFFANTRGLRLENVTIHAMHGIGLVCQHCENVRYTGVKCVSKEGRTATSNADFFHFSGCRGKIEIDGCRAEGGHDDFVNVHGTYMKPIAVNGNRVLLAFCHPNTYGFADYAAGDKIEFVQKDTLIPFFRSRVKGIERKSDTQYEVLLKDDAERLPLGGCYACNASASPKVYIHDNYFGYNAARGILCTTRGKTRIFRNTFYRVSGNALNISDDCNHWFESGFVKDVAFSRNRLIGCAYGFEDKGEPIVCCVPEVRDKNSLQRVHGRVVIKKNAFLLGEGDEKRDYRIAAEYTRSLVVRDNFFDCGYKIEGRNAKITDKRNRVKSG